MKVLIVISQLFRRLKKEGEVISLQQKSETTKSPIGSKFEKWVDVQELEGRIFETTERVFDSEGDRDHSASPLSSIKTTGYFLPFHIDETQEYRIKRLKDGKTTLYNIYHFSEKVRNGRDEFTKVVLRKSTQQSIE